MTDYTYNTQEFPVGTKVLIKSDVMPEYMGKVGTVKAVERSASGNVHHTVSVGNGNPTYSYADSLELVEPVKAEQGTKSKGDLLAEGDRMEEYGSPVVSFKRIGRLWSEYLSAPQVDPENLTAEDVGMLMILLKVSRRITDKKPDTLDDIEGYVSCVRMVEAAA